MGHHQWKTKREELSKQIIKIRQNPAYKSEKFREKHNIVPHHCQLPPRRTTKHTGGKQPCNSDAQRTSTEKNKTNEKFTKRKRSQTERGDQIERKRPGAQCGQGISGRSRPQEHGARPAWGTHSIAPISSGLACSLAARIGSPSSVVVDEHHRRDRTNRSIWSSPTHRNPQGFVWWFFYLGPPEK